MFRWDPQQYQQFAGARARPFGDLVAQIGAHDVRRVIDLGCGDGALTATLTDRWPHAEVIGLDSSAEMLAQAEVHIGPRLGFRQADISHEAPDPQADVVVSNALFQWVPEHVDVLRRWTCALADSAWFAFQVPGNFAAASHVLMREQADSPRWKPLLPEGILRHEDATLAPKQYAGVFLDQGWSADAWETTYVHLLAGEDPVLDWLRGTGLRPVLAALPAGDVAAFEAEYAARLHDAYPGPGGRADAVPVPAGVLRRPRSGGGVVITGYDHVQVAVPARSEDVARAFYGGLLGMAEQAKPAALADRGGCWFSAGVAVLHLGVEEPFRPAAKAHPAFIVTDLDDLAGRLGDAGRPVTWSTDEIPGVRRFHSNDPFGNRLEFQGA